MVIAPEQPTLMERFPRLFHLPYLIACTLIVVFVFGDPIHIVITYLTTGDVAVALEGVDYVPADTVLTVALVYVLHLSHYLRRKILETEKSLSALLPNGEEDFHKLFGRVSAIKPQLAIFVPVFALGAPIIYELADKWPPTLPGFLAELTIRTAVYSLAAASALWIFFYSLWGIHRMGSISMNLRSYYDDPTLGLRPVGSLALSLAMAYFIWMGLLTLFFFLLTPVTQTPQAALLYGTMGFFTLLGLTMYFVPLRSVHLQMLQQKKIEKEKLNQKMAERFRDVKGTSDVGQALVLDLMERKVSQIAVWPFDTAILVRLGPWSSYPLRGLDCQDNRSSLQYLGERRS